MVEDTVCTIGVYGGRQPSILVNNHLVYGRMPDSETQPDIIADVPKTGSLPTSTQPPTA